MIITHVQLEKIKATLKSKIKSYFQVHTFHHYFTLIPISQKLFSITTNGGSEYCGAVMDKSIKEYNAWASGTSHVLVECNGDGLLFVCLIR